MSFTTDEFYRFVGDHNGYPRNRLAEVWITDDGIQVGVDADGHNAQVIMTAKEVEQFVACLLEAVKAVRDE